MLQPGKAVKITIYLSDAAKHRGVPVYMSLLDYLFKNGVAGASVFKGVAGFGAAHRMHSAGILDISDGLPIKIEFVESREKVEVILDELKIRACSGLMEMQETTVICSGNHSVKTSDRS
jgi:PII-like signaling protein